MRHIESDSKDCTFSRTTPRRAQNLAALAAAFFSTSIAVHDVLAARNDPQKALRVETDLANFIDDAEDGLEYVDSAMRANVKDLVAYVRKNQNVRDRHRKNNGSDIPPGHEHGFSFEFSSTLRNKFSQMRGPVRLITLPDNSPLCADDIIFCSYGVHEIHHMMWDDEIRRLILQRVIALSQYDDFYSTKGRPVIVSEESRSWALQCEVLNAVTRGEFRKRVEKGPPKGASSREVHAYVYAQKYFSSPETFEAFVRSEYAKFSDTRFFDDRLSPE